MRKMLISAITAVFFVQSSFGAEVDDLIAGFKQPPPEARPWVYWFWMNGNLTREGITADLEAMHGAGIGGVLIMHVGAGIPAGPVKFFSNQWRELFRFAVSEAERLGMEVSMNACDGWTGTGGPWIKPEEAMMKLVWTKKTINGVADEPITLAQPETTLGVYHDVAVLAFPTPPANHPASRIRRRKGNPHIRFNCLVLRQ